jgi:hypothetical protein
MAGECPTGCNPGSPLFARMTLIILGAVAVWLFVVGILNLVVINQQVPTAEKDSLTQSTFVLNILQVIVGFLVLLWIAYAVLAPRGTFKDIIQPYIEARGDAGVATLKRRITTTTTSRAD